MTFLRCTVMDAGANAVHDVELTVQPETAISSVLAALPVATGGRRVHVGPAPLDPDATVADSALTPGCLVCVGAPVADHRQVPPEAGGVLRVLAGPDAGRWAWVPAGGGAVVGRGDRADLVLRDPQVSRLHAGVVPGGDAGAGAVVHDRGSGNGTTVAGSAIERPTALPRGGAFGVGSSVVQWLPLERVDHDWRRAPDGRIEFTRRFHNAPAPAPVTVELPGPAPTSSRTSLALAGSVLAPLALGLVMYAVTRSPLSLLTALLFPIPVALTYYAERRGRGRQEADFSAQQARAAADIAAAVAAEERVRRLNDPDELSLTLCALGGLPGLWAKRLGGRDALTIRVGVRDEAAQVELRGERWPGLEPPRLRAVPVTVDLRATGVLGVVGDRAMAAGLSRWLVLQLAARRSPEDLSLAVLSVDDGAHLRWTRWLPHVDTGEDGDAPCRIATTPAARAARAEELRALVEGREKARHDAREVTFDRDVVVVLDGARELRRLGGMRTVLQRGPDVGVYTICVDDEDVNECRGRVRVDAGGGLEVVRGWSDTAERATAETSDPEDAERLARLLAPMRDRAQASAGADSIPYPVRYLDLVELGDPAPEDVVRLWAATPGPTTRAPLGADARGVVHVDIARQGPHTMLGGATGAGKSILLQTLVASLLLHNRPDELNLVLVDFKGGAAFLPFADCPHVVGLIRSTNDSPADRFDDAAAGRVLASIRAEVERRERLLARHGGEIDEFLRARVPAQAPLPRLLLVFDEFARALEAVPGFVRELVSVTAKGRSLGMHLLLATQSLRGKLTPEMKNNIELRISLRQNEPEDSTEVLDVADAAAIPGRLKGRGLILCTKDDPPLARPFQAGYLGDPPPTGQAPPARARVVDWPAVGDPRPAEDRRETTEPTDQDRLIHAINRAAARLDLPTPHRPLKPPLPAALALDGLDRVASAPCPPDGVPYGLADLPAEQAQPVEHLSLSGDDQLMIAGGSRSGRTTAVRTLLHAAATAFSADDLHLYAVEREPGELAAYADLPHCGGVIGPTEPDRIRRLVTWLGEETTRRLAAGPAGGARPPTVLALIDGWEAIHDPTDHASIETSLVGVLRNVIKSGPKVGVRVVVTCDRGPLATKPGDLFATKMVLTFPQEDVRRNALPSRTALPPRLPGRAADAATGRHVQIATPSESPEALADRLAQAIPRLRRAPRQFPRMPYRLDAASIARPDGVSAGWVPLGVGGASLEPAGVDLFAGPQALLVSGAGGAGRSTAAAVAALTLSAQGVGCVVLATPTSPLAALLAGRQRIAVLLGPTVADEVVRNAAAALDTERVVVVVDDCEKMTVLETKKNAFEELPSLLAEAVTPERLGRMGVVLCGDAFPLLAGPRRALTGLARHAVSVGARVLLMPTTPAAAREHEISLEADQFLPGPPGRGYLRVGREQMLVQLPVPASQSVDVGDRVYHAASY
jgi:S-DNA-T family DNA segregation ATPase FtsK/SpoIIIE